MGFCSAFHLIFIKMVHILYTCLTVSVQTGLSLKQLARAVKEYAIFNIIIKRTSHHLSLYADNVVLYLSDIANSAHYTLNFFHKCRSFYKINWPKSITWPAMFSTQKHTQAQADACESVTRLFPGKLGSMTAASSDKVIWRQQLC